MNTLVSVLVATLTLLRPLSDTTLEVFSTYMPFAEPLSTLIDNRDLTVSWSIDYANKPVDRRVDYGTTRNRLFQTGVMVQGEFETVLDVATRTAKGKQPVSDNQRRQIVDAVWGEFASLNVESVRGTTMLYYGPRASQPEPGPQDPKTLPGLMSHYDGRCGAWATFMVATLRVLGISASERGILLNPAYWPGDPFFHLGRQVQVRGFRVTSMPGQGGHTLPSQFRNLDDHAVVLLSGDDTTLFLDSVHISDPSYGRREVDVSEELSLLRWDEAMIEAINVVAIVGGDIVDTRQPWPLAPDVVLGP
jgi:hypothetical protein